MQPNDSSDSYKRMKVCIGLMFYPRGGSSHAVRAQDQQLRGLGIDTTLVSGSYGQPGDGGHAQSFYKDSNVVAVDYTEGLGSTDPATTEHPVMASYEDKPGVPDRIFMSIDDLQYERMVDHWMEAFMRAGVKDTQIVHLNHLTPMHEAALRLKERNHSKLDSNNRRSPRGITETGAAHSQLGWKELRHINGDCQAG